MNSWGLQWLIRDVHYEKLSTDISKVEFHKHSIPSIPPSMSCSIKTFSKFRVQLTYLQTSTPSGTSRILLTTLCLPHWLQNPATTTKRRNLNKSGIIEMRDQLQWTQKSFHHLSWPLVRVQKWAVDSSPSCLSIKLYKWFYSTPDRQCVLSWTMVCLTS